MKTDISISSFWKWINMKFGIALLFLHFLKLHIIFKNRICSYLSIDFWANIRQKPADILKKVGIMRVLVKSSLKPEIWAVYWCRPASAGKWILNNVRVLLKCYLSPKSFVLPPDPAQAGAVCYTCSQPTPSLTASEKVDATWSKLHDNIPSGANYDGLSWNVSNLHNIIPSTSILHSKKENE